MQFKISENMINKESSWVTSELGVEIFCSMQRNDYHDQVLFILEKLPKYLYGGHYEPKSDRDIKLAQELDKFCRDYKDSSNT